MQLRPSLARWFTLCAVLSLLIGGAAPALGQDGSAPLPVPPEQSDLAQADPTDPLSGIVAIDSGSEYSCALSEGGGVVCWGHNTYGQLGNGTTETNFNMPMHVTGLGSGVTAISAGERHTCAVTATGGVLCWGYGSHGQVGGGTTYVFNPTPVAVSGLESGVAAVSAGAGHTCALTTAGGVLCWGWNEYGQLGNGTPWWDSATPVAVTGLESGVAAISAGANHTCALTTAGAVMCWGDNGGGRLGDGTIFDRSTPVAAIGLGSDMAAVSGGGFHNCALTTAGAIKCSGANNYGQLGDGTYSRRYTPVGVSGFNSGAAAISAGDEHTCAMTTAGDVMCWGINGLGTLGDGTTTTRNIPVAVSGLSSGVMAVSAGGTHTCALTTTGGVLCWGGNRYGELGDGTNTNHATPAPVLGGAQLPTFAARGRVTANGAGLAGVTFDAGGKTAVTNIDGDYLLDQLAAGSYTLTPSKEGYTFAPANREITVPPGATGIDFVVATSTVTESWLPLIMGSESGQ